MKKVILGLIFCGLTAMAQAPTPVIPSKYDKVDHLTALLTLEKEKTLNLQVVAFQKNYDDTLNSARKQYTEYEQAINAWVERVRKENGWDASYNYDRSTDTWTHTITVQPKTAQPKPALSK